MKNRTAIEEHFDDEALRYDYWKEKNWYYYDALKVIAGKWTTGARSVLDAGCGTGTILTTISAPERVGIDISSEMIDIAKKRHGHDTSVSFVASTIEGYDAARQFDRIISFDVIEHLEHYEKAVTRMSELLHPDGRLIISMANPLWEPILLVAEWLKMKMPEGPHVRISEDELLAVASRAGLQLSVREYRLLFPKYIPGVSYVLNDIVGTLPFLRRLCVIEVFVFTHKS